MRYLIRIDPIWQPFMLFLAATHSNSFVEIEGDDLRLSFGPAFRQTIALDNVVGAAERSWSIFNGLGVRAGGKIFALVGSTAGVVEMRLRSPVAMRFAAWPWTVDRIAVSLEDPQAFIDAIDRRSPDSTRAQSEDA